MPTPAPTVSCCPIGYTFVTLSGTYFNYQTGLMTPVINSGPSLAGVVGKCCTIANGNFAMPSNPTVSPIECLCCPAGYTYASTTGMCVMDGVPKNTTRPVPCISCNCITPSNPGCPVCTTSAKPINFNYDFSIKECNKVVLPPTTTCCPQYQIYVDSDGYFNSPLPFPPGLYQISNSPTTPFLNTCVIMDNWKFAVAVPNSPGPIDCPCCPDGYLYDTVKQLCVNLAGGTTGTAPCSGCGCCDEDLENEPSPSPCEAKFMPIQYAIPNILGFRFTAKNYI